MINIKQWTARGKRGTQHNKQNRAFKINNEMNLTFVFIYRNAAMFAGNINNCMIICNNDVVKLSCIGQNKDQFIVNM